MKRDLNQFRETVADRILRQEQQRFARLDGFLGGSATAKAIYEYEKLARLDREARQSVGLLASDPTIKAIEMASSIACNAALSGTVAEAIRAARANQGILPRQLSNAWSLSIAETARSVAEGRMAFVERQRKLSETALETARAIEQSHALLSISRVSSDLDAKFRGLVSGVLPELSTFSAIAERARKIDSLVLQASEISRGSVTELAAEMVIETHRIAEAIVDAPSDEGSSRLYEMLLSLVVSFMVRLGPNTVEELHKMGLSGFLGLILNTYTVVGMLPHDAKLAEPEQAAFDKLGTQIRQYHEEVVKHGDAKEEAEKAFLARYPRAMTTRVAYLRQTPNRAGDLILTLPEGQPVAVVERRGKWSRISYRDVLSAQLSQAWVYNTALQPVALAVSESIVAGP